MEKNIIHTIKKRNNRKVIPRGWFITHFTRVPVMVKNRRTSPLLEPIVQKRNRALWNYSTITDKMANPIPPSLLSPTGNHNLKPSRCQQIPDVRMSAAPILADINGMSRLQGGDNLVDNAVFLGFFSGQEVIPVHILLHLLQRLAGPLGGDAV